MPDPNPIPAMDPRRTPPGDAAYIDWLRHDRPNVCISITRSELSSGDIVQLQQDGHNPEGLAQYSIAAVVIRLGRPCTGFTHFIAERNAVDFSRIKDFYPYLNDMVTAALEAMNQVSAVNEQEQQGFPKEQR